MYKLTRWWHTFKLSLNQKFTKYKQYSRIKIKNFIPPYVNPTVEWRQFFMVRH